MDRYIGRMLDNRYEILEVLGTGGMAVVYKARCHRLNRLVAIKILKEENSQDEQFRRRFRAEGQAVGMLSHPNIVAVYDVSTNKDADYIVMELIDGISLKQYMEKKGVLNWKETLHFATQIAKALEHAHSKGLVHRDIKPHNVMVLKNGAVRVTDFGIARVASKSSTMTKEALGSVHYISPEQAKGGRVDCRSDLYSLGVVMYEMITGRPPFDGESPVAVALQHIAGGATKPSVLNPNIPEGLEQIIMKTMAHDTKDRYANAAALLEDLDTVRKDPTVVFTAEHLAAAPVKPVEKPKAQEMPEEAPAREEKKMPRKQTKPAPKPKAAKEVPAAKEPRKKKEKTREDIMLSRDRTATILIILCALAALAAVVLMLGTWVQDSQPTQVQMVKVPRVVGVHFDRLQQYDVEIVKQSTAYSEEHNAGVIIKQLPEAGTEVELGSKVFVVVSLGPEPEEVTMPDLVGKTKMEAQMYLNGLNMKLKIEWQEEHDDVVPAGSVLKTTPAAGKTLWEGDAVTVYLSLGKEIDTAIMPDLVNGSANYKTAAENQMKLLEFKNVEWVPVDYHYGSSAERIPAGKIISQSVPAGEEVDLTAKIVITYSSGITVNSMPNLMVNNMKIATAEVLMLYSGFTNVHWLPVDSSAPVGTVLSQSVAAGTVLDVATMIVVEYSNGSVIDPVTIPYTIELPARDTAYLLTMTYTDENGQTHYLLVDQEILAGQTGFTLELTGKSVQQYMLFIDGTYYKTISVDFGTDKVENGQ